MPADDILLDAEERMEKAVEVFRHAMTGIRTGRANPGIVDSLRVEVYGSPTPIKALANVGAPEPNQIVVRPFDPGTLKDIEKAKNPKANITAGLQAKSTTRRSQRLFQARPIPVAAITAAAPPERAAPSQAR